MKNFNILFVIVPLAAFAYIIGYYTNKPTTNSCEYRKVADESGIPSSVGKFQDGHVICYTYYQHSISCVTNW